MVHEACRAPPCLRSSAARAAAPVDIVDHRGAHIQVGAPVSRVAIFPLPIPEAMIANDFGIDPLAGINPPARSTRMTSLIGQLYVGIASINTDLVSRDFAPKVEAPV